MDTVRIVILILSTMTTGLITGAYLLYAHAIMPGLRSTDDRTFVTSFAAIDRAIINPVFMLTSFLGALFVTIAAAVLSIGRPTFAWVLVALILNLAAVIITMTVHVPLNNSITGAAGSDGFDPTAVRAAFHAARWEAWNYVRVACATIALGCLCWALITHGRVSAG